MEISILFAKVLGLYLLVASFLLIFMHKELVQRINALAANPYWMFPISALLIILGLFLVILHNIWVPDWRVVVTILAWLTLIKGLIYFFVPQITLRVAKIYDKPTTSIAIGILSVIISIFLIYHGFFAA